MITPVLTHRIIPKVLVELHQASTEPESAHLYADDFSVFYGTNEAVKKVTLGIPAGLVTAIIGPSGCGKTTFLRAINRMNDLIPGCYAQGRLLLDGEDIYSSGVDAVALRKRVGMVFQKPNPFPKSVFDNVAYGPRIHGLRRRSELAGIVEHSLASQFWLPLPGKPRRDFSALEELTHNPCIGLSQPTPCSSKYPVQRVPRQHSIR